MERLARQFEKRLFLIRLLHVDKPRFFWTLLLFQWLSFWVLIGALTVFIAFKVDGLINWPWGSVCFPLWMLDIIMLVASSIGLGRYFHLCGELERGIQLDFYLWTVIGTPLAVISQVLVVLNLDGQDTGSFAADMAPMFTFFAMLFCFSCCCRSHNTLQILVNMAVGLYGIIVLVFLVLQLDYQVPWTWHVTLLPVVYLPDLVITLAMGVIVFMRLQHSPHNFKSNILWYLLVSFAFLFLVAFQILLIATLEDMVWYEEYRMYVIDVPAMIIFSPLWVFIITLLLMTVTSGIIDFLYAKSVETLKSTIYLGERKRVLLQLLRDSFAKKAAAMSAEFEERYMDDFRKLLDRKDIKSDLRFVTSDGQEIYAHRAILEMRADLFDFFDYLEQRERKLNRLKRKQSFVRKHAGSETSIIVPRPQKPMQFVPIEGVEGWENFDDKEKGKEKETEKEKEKEKEKEYQREDGEDGTRYASSTQESTSDDAEGGGNGDASTESHSDKSSDERVIRKKQEQDSRVVESSEEERKKEKNTKKKNKRKHQKVEESKGTKVKKGDDTEKEKRKKKQKKSGTKSEGEADEVRRKEIKRANKKRRGKEKVDKPMEEEEKKKQKKRVRRSRVDRIGSGMRTIRLEDGISYDDFMEFLSYLYCGDANYNPGFTKLQEYCKSSVNPRKENYLNLVSRYFYENENDNDSDTDSELAYLSSSSSSPSLSPAFSCNISSNVTSHALSEHFKRGFEMENGIRAVYKHGRGSGVGLSRSDERRRSRSESGLFSTSGNTMEGHAAASRHHHHHQRRTFHETSDIVFEVEGRLIRAHKCVLAARCEYFEAMFKFKESNEESITIDDVSYPVFFAFLQAIYTGKTDAALLKIDDAQEVQSEGRRFSWRIRSRRTRRKGKEGEEIEEARDDRGGEEKEELWEFIRLCNQYRFLAPLLACQEYLVELIRPSNVLDVLLLSDYNYDYYLQPLRDYCMYYILIDYERISKLQKFQKLSSALRHEIIAKRQNDLLHVKWHPQSQKVESGNLETEIRKWGLYRGPSYSSYVYTGPMELELTL